jgi:hypothetical protein
VTPVPGSTDISYLNEIIVELDPDALGASADQVVSALQSAAADNPFAARLGHPSNSRVMAITRLPQRTLDALPTDDPAYKLQNTVILTYADDDTTARAQMDLARDPSVRSQSRNALIHYSTDPLVAIASDPAKYQWGLYTINAIQSNNQIGIWAKTTGSAYVAMLDNGLKTAGGVHEDLAGNYRSQFSYNYGYSNDGPNGGPLSSDNLDETPFTGYNFAGHGTHTAGLVAAWNGNNLGGGGVCPTCSIMAGRVSQVYPNGSSWYIAPNIAYIATGMSDMAFHGAQVVNNSFGEPDATCATEPSWCSSLGYAESRDVVLVAASGNHAVAVVDFPANQPNTFAVGGVSSSGQFWAGSGGFGSNYTALSTIQQFVAPASVVISSMYPNTDWIPAFNCGDNFPPSFMIGYGDCTGTSMAAPHVTGIVGLMRSVDPLKNRQAIRDILAGTSNTTLCTDANATKCELGVPDATKAVTAALGGNNVLNRTSPLFTFYSSTAQDHFYTYVPQMAMAAMASGGLLPQPVGQTVLSYQGVGPSISQYAAFPTNTCSPTPCSNTPKAIAVILTTQVNPSGGAALVPLYRMSFKCGDELLTNPPNPQDPACVSNPSHLSHVYSTSSSGVQLYTGYDPSGVYVGGGAGYKLDGVEGYIFPTTAPQPVGAVHLCRKYDPARDDYVMFTGAGAGGLDCSATTDGYTGGNYYQTAGGTDWVGWVYPVGTSLAATPSNAAPTAAITSPANGASFTKGTSITVKASASDSDGSVASVRFFLDQQLLGIDTTSPYSIVWTANTKGTFSLTAIAVDNRGAITKSSAKSVTITGTGGGGLAFANPGFETPALGTGNYQYGPTGGSWTFDPAGPNGGSGISGNGSAFTFQNPNAPEGVQVGFIQSVHPIAQTLALTAGTYHLTFYAAQRYSNQQFLQLQIQVDGGNVANIIQPTTTSYASYSTGAFAVTDGPHNIALVGVNPYSGDNTIFVDSITISSP